MTSPGSLTRDPRQRRGGRSACAFAGELSGAVRDDQRARLPPDGRRTCISPLNTTKNGTGRCPDLDEHLAGRDRAPTSMRRDSRDLRRVSVGNRRSERATVGATGVGGRSGPSMGNRLTGTA